MGFILPPESAPQSQLPGRRTFATTAATTPIAGWRRYKTTAAAGAATPPPPLALPEQLDEPSATQGPEMPMRVPLLLETGLVRPHRHEHVPAVAPSSISLLARLRLAPSGGQTAFARAQQPASEPLLAPRADDTGDAMTDDKVAAAKLAGVAAAVWWLAGEPVMRLFGIL